MTLARQENTYIFHIKQYVLFQIHYQHYYVLPDQLEIVLLFGSEVNSFSSASSLGGTTRVCGTPPRKAREYPLKPLGAFERHTVEHHGNQMSYHDG